MYNDGQNWSSQIISKAYIIASIHAYSTTAPAESRIALFMACENVTESG